MNVIDHKEQAQSRVYAQYRNKPKAMDWIAINGELGNEIETAYQGIVTSYDIDNANTDELDILGRIVVIGREYESQLLVPQFGCNDTNVECGEISVECTPQNLTEDQVVSDSFYKLLIKAKIAKNNNDATLDGIISAIGELLGTPLSLITIQDNEDMSFSVTIGRPLSSIERIALTVFDIIPKPQGVELSGFIELPNIVSCGESWAECGDDRAECTFIFT